jgi:tetratricopeptide (TPR) repeat protein
MILVCSATVVCYGQIPDSTRRLMDNLERDASKHLGDDRYEMIFKVAYDLFDVDNAEAVKYAEEAFGVARELGDSAKIVRSGRIYGQLLRRVGELDSAIDIMVSIKEIAERRGYEKDLRFLCNALAIAHTFRGEYDKALEFNFKSLELRQENGDKIEVAIAQSNIANTFYQIGIYDRAAEFFKNSLLTDSTNVHASDIKVGLVLCYEKLNYVKEASQLIERIVSQYKGKLAPITFPRIEIALGYIDLRQGRLESAMVHFKSGYELASRLSHKAYMSDCLAKLGEAYLTKRQFNLAERSLLQSDFYANQIGYRNGREVANMALAKLYSVKDDHINASIAKSNIIAIKDSSINQGVIENIYRHQFDFYQKEQRKTIATQTQLLSLQEKSIRYHTILNIVSWTCGMLLILVIIVLYRSNKFKKQITIELEKRVHERTAELRTTVESLQRAHLERNFMLDGIARRLNANIATIKGLSIVAATYDEMPKEFVKNVDRASDILASIIPQIARGKK